MTEAPPDEVTAGGSLYTRLRRVTTSNAYIPEIDGLRFIAISGVVLLHLGTAMIAKIPAEHWTAPPEEDWLRMLTYHGYVGVWIFFAISGFILSLPFARHHLRGAKPVDLPAYYWRRLTRLEPPYVIILLALFVVHVWMLRTGGFLELLPHLGASLFYLHNIIYGAWSVINPVAWTLEIEVQFYLLAPLLALLFRFPGKVARRIVLFLLMLGSIALGRYAGAWLTALHLDRSILVYGKYFLVGVLVADYYLTEMGHERRSRWWDVIGLSALIGAFAFPDATFDVLLIALLLVAVFESVTFRAFFRLRWVTVIGGMCYSIYLIHYAFLLFILLGTRRLAFNGPFWLHYVVQGAIGIPLMLTASALFFVLVEKPCMYPDWPRRLYRTLIPTRP